MAQSQEELQKRMASLVAELSGVMIQIESAGGTSGAAVSALLNPPAAASGIAATIAAAAAAAAAAPAPTAEVPAVVDPATAFSPAPFFVSSGGGEASATLEQDIANLISGTSGSAAPAAAPAPPPAPPQQQRNNANNNNNNNNYNGTSDMEKWMHQMMATHNGSQLTPHDVVTLLQQYMYGQQQQQPYGRGGYRGRGGAVAYGRGAGGGAAGRYGYPPYYAGNGRGSFPPAGSHFMGQYDGNYYADDGQEEMAHMVAVLYDQYMRMQRQGGTNGSNAQAPQGAQQQQQAHQPPPQAQQQPPAVAKPPPAPPAQPVQPAQPVPAKQVQSPTGSSFRPNLSAKPFRPPGAQPVYGVPISASNNEMMQTAFSNQKELKLGGNNKEEVVEEEEVHQVTGANAPRKRKGRKTAIPPAAGNTPAPAPEDEDDSNTPMGYVEFKRQKIKKYPCSGVVQPGQYVMVDGDRGLDCGLLVQMTAFGKDGLLHVVTLEGFEIEESRMKPERGRIIRVAENHEVDKLHSEICTAEKTALRACRQRCSDLNLKIEVLDCEYQFDMKKVSFYFNSNTSVDFRDLVRDLYRNFNARIWMENINPNVKNVVPHGSRHH